MGLLSWLSGGNDGQLAETSHAGHESATDRAARDGDKAGKQMPRRYRFHNG